MGATCITVLTVTFNSILHKAEHWRTRNTFGVAARWRSFADAELGEDFSKQIVARERAGDLAERCLREA